MGVAYELSTSWYIQQNGQDIWAPGADVLVLSRSPDGGEFQRVLGCASPNTEGMAVEDIIRQTAWGLSDLEVCLFRDGYPTPVGPGNWVELFPDLEPEVTFLEDWEPIYWPGDYWDEWSVEGVTARRYYNAELGSFHLNSMKVTRSDMYTQKGIRVGSTREEVMAAYPGAKAGNYWDMYPGEDLVYDIPGSEDTAELGPALLFFFDGDTVGQITLENMFN